MPDSCPKAICRSCGRRYSGWDLAQRETCDCGGKLIINFPYDVIMGYLKTGNRNNRQEELHEIWTKVNEAYIE